MENTASQNPVALLQYAVEHGMIDMSYVQDAIVMKERKEILEKHPYSVWKGTDDLWHTYLPDQVKGRVPRKRRTKEELDDVIIQYWLSRENDPQVVDVFYDWIERALAQKEISKATRDRYISDFKRFFLKGDEFGRRHIKSITVDELEKFIKDTIAEQQLTSKGFSGFRLLLNGIFKECRKQVGFSITQVISDMRISRRSFRKVIKEDAEEVFTEDEYPIVINYLLEHQDIINLGLLLIFMSGIRVGEVCTLSPDDLRTDNVYIHRTETIYKDDNGKYVYDVKEYPKTEAGVRHVAIPSANRWILDRLIAISYGNTYVFQEKGEHIKALKFRKRLTSICYKVGIVKKTPHKARKTYGSILLDNCVDKRFVIEQMGHSDVLTTEKNYHMNRRAMIKKIEVLDKIDDLCIINKR